MKACILLGLLATVNLRAEPTNDWTDATVTIFTMCPPTA
jgi:hypothetical protein